MKKLRELPYELADKLELPEDLDRQVSARTGGQIDSHTLVFYGRCARCCAADAAAEVSDTE